MRRYTIKSGDTLEAIAFDQLGAVARVAELFAANRATIVNEQRRRRVNARALVLLGQAEHYACPAEMNFIYPGTVLVLPSEGERYAGNW